MKITHIISDGNVGGAGVLLLYLSEALKTKYDWEVLLPEGSLLKDRLCEKGVKTVELPFHADRSFAPSDIPVLYRYLRKSRPDIVHTHACLSGRVSAFFSGAGMRISSRHCIQSVVSIKKNALKSTLYNALTSLTVSTAEYATAELIRQGIPPSKIITVQNGVPPVERLHADERRNLRRRLGLEETDTVFGCCARLTAVKGQDLLLFAAAKLAPEYPGLKLLIVGGGEDYEYLYTLCSLLHLSERVVFTGYVCRPGVYQNLFDWNVCVSRGTETSSLVISECMSLGIPTIASGVGGNPEMISDGKNGYLFRAEDVSSLVSRMRQCLNAPYVRTVMGQNAFLTYESRFSVVRMARAYDKIYQTAYLPSAGRKDLRKSVDISVAI